MITHTDAQTAIIIANNDSANANIISIVLMIQDMQSAKLKDLFPNGSRSNLVGVDVNLPFFSGNIISSETRLMI